MVNATDEIVPNCLLFNVVRAHFETWFAISSIESSKEFEWAFGTIRMWPLLRGFNSRIAILEAFSATFIEDFFPEHVATPPPFVECVERANSS